MVPGSPDNQTRRDVAKLELDDPDLVKRGLNMNLQYVNYDTTYLTQFSGMEVATSNIISYSNSNGEINNMKAHLGSMVGDTMKLTARWYDGKKDFYIILD